MFRQYAFVQDIEILYAKVLTLQSCGKIKQAGVYHL